MPHRVCLAVLLLVVSCAPDPGTLPPPTSATSAAACTSGSATAPVRTTQGPTTRRLPTVGRTHYVVLQAPCAVDRMRRDAAAGRIPNTSAYVRQLAQSQDRLVPEVRAAGGRVVGRLTRLANALLVVVADPAAVARLGRLAGVRRVEPAPLYRPHLTQSVPVVGAPTVWQSTADLLGRNVRVGVIDSGIDYTHAAFGGSGQVADYLANDASIIEPGTFPTIRVVDGTDLVGDFYDSGDSALDVPQPDPDPLDCPRPDSSGHGTHVASIVGGGGVTSAGAAYVGPYDVSLDPAAFEVGPGVAPAADLYAIKVFGCGGGSTSVVTLALEWAADPDGDGLFDDHLDVVNLSLGSKFGLGSTDRLVTENLVWLGTVVVASSGNTASDVKRARPFFVTDSPGVVHPVISVANTWKTTAQFRSLEIEGAAVPLGPFPLAEGRDNPTVETTGTVTGPLRRPVNRDGCDPFQNASQFPGAMALIDRGGCSFNTKFENAEAAGAVAAIVVDWSGHDVPWTMTNIAAALPGGMIRTPHGEALHAALDNGEVLTVTLDAGTWWPITVGPDYIKDSSCRGPSAWDGLLKPDLAAPGTSIVAAASGTGWESTVKSGTSMSAPHVAGAAALLLEADGALTPLEVKARLMSTARVTRDPEGNPFPVSLAGAGRMQVDAALDSPAYFATLDATGNPSPLVSASWDAQVSASPLELTHTVQVVNTSTAPVTYAVSAEPFGPLSGTTVTVSPTTVTVDAGAASQIELRLAVDPAQLPTPTVDGVTPPATYPEVGRHFLVECDGLIRLTPTSPTTAPPLSLPYHSLVRAAGQRQAGAVAGCVDDTGATSVRVTLTDNTTMNASQITSAFVHLPGAETAPLLALGVAHNLDEASDDPDVEPTLFFGVATTVQWLLPARYSRSAVGLYIDVDGDDEPDFRVAMDSETESGDDDFGNADIFTVRVYPYDEWAGEEYTPLRVNVVDPRSLRVPVHLSGVWVLPVPLADLGLDPDLPPPPLSVRAWARQLDEEIVEGELVSFDPADLPFNPTVTGWPVPGFGSTPLHTVSPLTVALSPADTTGDRLAPELLLLHHTNEPGARVEVISLDPADHAYEQGDVGVVTENGPGQTTAGRTAAATFIVTNHGPGDLADVLLDVTLLSTGVAMGDATVVATPGVCTGPNSAGAIHCDLGALSEAAQATVTVTVAVNHPGTLAFDARVTTALGCAALPNNDTATRLVTVESPPDPPIEQTPPKKGCGCQAQGSAGSGGIPALALIMLVLWWVRRHKRNPRRHGQQREPKT